MILSTEVPMVQKRLEGLRGLPGPNCLQTADADGPNRYGGAHELLGCVEGDSRIRVDLQANLYKSLIALCIPCRGVWGGDR